MILNYIDMNINLGDFFYNVVKAEHLTTIRVYLFQFFS